MEINSILLFLILLTAVAFLYSSVGHGGASGYLALMAFFSFAPNMMKPTALLLNLFVAAIAFFQFYKRGYLNFKLFLSFAMGSIPAAFFGGLIEVDESLYKQILAVLLIVAIFRLLNISGNSKIIVRPKLAINIVIGNSDWFSIWFNWYWWWNNFNSSNFNIELGRNERSSCSFCIIYLGEFCIWYDRSISIRNYN